MLGLHLRTTGDERWNAPFDIVRDGENTFTWFHSAIADHLHQQWTQAPDGCHCENTKVWPYCLAGAGLGLQLHDLLRGTDHHAVFDRWWRDVCRSKYLHLDGDELPQAVTLYYDPILDVHHEVPVMFGMVPAPYLAPQVPDDARRLFEAGMRQFGMWESTEAVAPIGPRVSATALWMAKEWGSDRSPTRSTRWWTSTTSRRGTGRAASSRGASISTSRTRAASTTGRWPPRRSRPSRRGHGSPPSGPAPGSPEPTVVDVDFPTVALSEAWWDRA